jgi:hypothetical protein
MINTEVEGEQTINGVSVLLAVFPPSLLFYYEYEGNRILRNVGIYVANYPTSHIKKTPWLWSASELCRPSDRRFLAK